MKNCDQNLPRSQRKQQPRRVEETRWGSVVVLSAGMMVMVFGFLAFSVDVGYIALTKSQLEAASDAGSRGAVIELKDALGKGASKTPEQAQAAAQTAAVAVAAANRAGDQLSIYADPTRDVRVGHVIYDPGSGTWVKQWGVSPYNMVELTLHRDQTGGGAADGPLPLFFAPVIGNKNASLASKGIAAIMPGNGFRVPAGSGQRANLLPFALDEYTWNALINNNLDQLDKYQDKFTCDPKTGMVTSGPDGIIEINLYPYGNDELPPGNRGTVDLGASNNSTSDLARQILYGMNEHDFSYFPNHEVRASYDQPLMLNGDTGISAGMKDELASIIGQSRAIPIFTAVSGNGNNAMYTVVKFRGIRIVDVKLTGNPKYVMIQPSPYTGETVTWDNSGAPFDENTIFTTPMLIR